MSFSTPEELIQLAHLTDEEIEGVIEDSLDDDRRETVERHIQACPLCRREIAVLKESLSESESALPFGSQEAMRQEIAQMYERIKGSHGCLWIDDRSFILETDADYPSLLKIKGLVLAAFEDARDRGLKEEGKSLLRLDRAGLDPMLVEIRDFEDVNEMDFEELKLAAKTEEKIEVEAVGDKLVLLETVYICRMEGTVLEILSNESATDLFLRLT